MSALDDDVLGTELVTDLSVLAKHREYLWTRRGYRLPLQDAEREAGLTDADIWRFLDAAAR
ncbi:hypothetical protein [[Mycobacterium] vasticus]|uniref:Uncharacterized protein n=1 Tax=[Mycobacterium] vasticus TaxID=2875777 RepID=A0ABU5YST0_9MYCO|nr:hypothetical protein [Mycolicibacter sp. MYC017]MEB3067966.1 hypothetical protein [Mycolicibacter sp. MYC017]